MKAEERKVARMALDEEMRPFRRARKTKNPTKMLLREVRKALGVPVEEIALKLGVGRSVVFDVEAREPSNKVWMKSVARMAEAMGCTMVYGIVPKDGKTLEELAERRLWEAVIGKERD